jgi:hypothetical protein
MDKTDHLMGKSNKNNKDSQKGHVTPKKKILSEKKLCSLNETFFTDEFEF